MKRNFITLGCLAASLCFCCTLGLAAEIQQKGQATVSPPPKVTQILYSPTPAKAGAPLTVSVKVENSGKQASGDKYSLWLDCKTLSGGECPFSDSLRPLQSINAGSSHTASLNSANSWQAGKYRISASVVDQSRNRIGVMKTEITVAPATARPASNGTMTNQLVKPGETHGFIPQPEPPGNKSANKYVKPGEAQGFIPQPEPPGKAAQ